MPHPATRSEILEALASNAASVAEYFSTIPEAAFFAGHSERWAPAHHLVHLARTHAAVERGLRSGALPPHPAGRSRTYAEVRDAVTAALVATPRECLSEMGKTVVVAPGERPTDVVRAYADASASLRAAAEPWSEAALDRFAMAHPLAGVLTVREMLLFSIVHERHHLKSVRTRLAA